MTAQKIKNAKMEKKNEKKIEKTQNATDAGAQKKEKKAPAATFADVKRTAEIPGVGTVELTLCEVTIIRTGETHIARTRKDCVAWLRSKNAEQKTEKAKAKAERIAKRMSQQTEKLPARLEKIEQYLSALAEFAGLPETVTADLNNAVAYISSAKLSLAGAPAEKEE